MKGTIMTMQAIRLCKKNLKTVRKIDQSMSKAELLQCAVGCGCLNQGPLYYIPQFESLHTDYVGYAIMSQPTFSQCFNADMFKIETDFVEITRR